MTSALIKGVLFVRKCVVCLLLFFVLSCLFSVPSQSRYASYSSSSSSSEQQQQPEQLNGYSHLEESSSNHNNHHHDSVSDFLSIRSIHANGDRINERKNVECSGLASLTLLDTISTISNANDSNDSKDSTSPAIKPTRTTLDMKERSTFSFTAGILYDNVMNLISFFSSSSPSCLFRSSTNDNNNNNNNLYTPTNPNRRSLPRLSAVLFAEAQCSNNLNITAWISGAPFRWREALKQNGPLNYQRYFMNLIQTDLQNQLWSVDADSTLTVQSMTPRMDSVPNVGCDLGIFVACSKFTSATELRQALAKSTLPSLASDPSLKTYFDGATKLRVMPAIPSEAMIISRRPDSPNIAFPITLTGLPLFWMVALDKLREQPDYEITTGVMMPFMDMLAYIFQEDLQQIMDPNYQKYVVNVTIPADPVDPSAFHIDYTVYLVDLTQVEQWDRTINVYKTSEGVLNTTSFQCQFRRVNDEFDTFWKDNADTVAEYRQLIPDQIVPRWAQMLRDSYGVNLTSYLEVVDTNSTDVVLYFTGVAAGWMNSLNTNITPVVSAINRAMRLAFQRRNYTYDTAIDEIRLIPDEISVSATETAVTITTTTTTNKKQPRYYPYYPANTPENNNTPSTPARTKAFDAITYDNSKFNTDYAVGMLVFVTVRQLITNASVNPYTAEQIAAIPMYGNYSALNAFYDHSFDGAYNFSYRPYQPSENETVYTVSTPALYATGTLYDVSSHPLHKTFVSGMVYMGVGIVGAMIVTFFIVLIISCCCCPDTPETDKAGDDEATFSYNTEEGFIYNPNAKDNQTNTTNSTPDPLSMKSEVEKMKREQQLHKNPLKGDAVSMDSANTATSDSQVGVFTPQTNKSNSKKKGKKEKQEEKSRKHKRRSDDLAILGANDEDDDEFETEITATGGSKKGKVRNTNPFVSALVEDSGDEVDDGVHEPNRSSSKKLNKQQRQQQKFYLQNNNNNNSRMLESEDDSGLAESADVRRELKYLQGASSDSSAKKSNYSRSGTNEARMRRALEEALTIQEARKRDRKRQARSDNSSNSNSYNSEEEEEEDSEADEEELAALVLALYNSQRNKTSPGKSSNGSSRKVRRVSGSSRNENRDRGSDEDLFQTPQKETELAAAAADNLSNDSRRQRKAEKAAVGAKVLEAAAGPAAPPLVPFTVAADLDNVSRESSRVKAPEKSRVSPKMLQTMQPPAIPAAPGAALNLVQEADSNLASTILSSGSANGRLSLLRQSNQQYGSSNFNSSVPRDKAAELLFQNQRWSPSPSPNHKLNVPSPQPTTAAGAATTATHYDALPNTTTGSSGNNNHPTNINLRQEDTLMSDVNSSIDHRNIGKNRLPEFSSFLSGGNGHQPPPPQQHTTIKGPAHSATSNPNPNHHSNSDSSREATLTAYDSRDWPAEEDASFVPTPDKSARAAAAAPISPEEAVGLSNYMQNYYTRQSEENSQELKKPIRLSNDNSPASSSHRRPLLANTNTNNSTNNVTALISGGNDAIVVSTPPRTEAILNALAQEKLHHENNLPKGTTENDNSDEKNKEHDAKEDQMKEEKNEKENKTEFIENSFAVPSSSSISPFSSSSPSSQANAEKIHSSLLKRSRERSVSTSRIAGESLVTSPAAAPAVQQEEGEKQPSPTSSPTHSNSITRKNTSNDDNDNNNNKNSTSPASASLTPIPGSSAQLPEASPLASTSALTPSRPSGSPSGRSNRKKSKKKEQRKSI